MTMVGRALARRALVHSGKLVVHTCTICRCALDRYSPIV